MSYKKPEIVASSQATQSYVAGCPAKTAEMNICSTNYACQCSSMQ